VLDDVVSGLYSNVVVQLLIAMRVLS